MKNKSNMETVDESYVYSEMIYGIYLPYKQVEHIGEQLGSKITFLEYDDCSASFFKTKAGYHFIGIRMNNRTLEDIQTKIRFDIIDTLINILCNRLKVDLPSKNIIDMHYIDTLQSLEEDVVEGINVLYEKEDTEIYSIAQIIYGIGYTSEEVNEIYHKNKNSDKPLPFPSLKDVSRGTTNREYLGIDITGYSLQELKELKLNEIHSKIKKDATPLFAFNEEMIKLHFTLY